MELEANRIHGTITCILPCISPQPNIQQEHITKRTIDVLEADERDSIAIVHEVIGIICTIIGGFCELVRCDFWINAQVSRDSVFI